MCVGVWVCTYIWVYGYMGAYVYGVYGCMGVWVYGCMGVWCMMYGVWVSVRNLYLKPLGICIHSWLQLYYCRVVGTYIP